MLPRMTGMGGGHTAGKGGRLHSVGIDSLEHGPGLQQAWGCTGCMFCMG